ncbi:hypothetical protein D3C86_1554020 [compost metagenome]
MLYCSVKNSVFASWTGCEAYCLIAGSILSVMRRSFQAFWAMRVLRSPSFLSGQLG